MRESEAVTVLNMYEIGKKGGGDAKHKKNHLANSRLQ